MWTYHSLIHRTRPRSGARNHTADLLRYNCRPYTGTASYYTQYLDKKVKGIDKDFAHTMAHVRLFVCLLVCLFGVFRPTREFFTHFAVEGLQILTYALPLWPFSSEGSIACHNFCDTGHPFIMVISKNP